jgi:hypothetical protein
MQNRNKQLWTAANLLAVLLLAAPLKAQVTIGSQSAPDPNAVLDLRSNSNRGFLLPRVTLDSLHSPAPLSAHVQGMFVYNTAAANDVMPGIYYNDGTQWVQSVGSYGTPTAPGQVLTANNPGQTPTWQNQALHMVNGTLGAGVDVPWVQSLGVNLYTGTSITLPPGKWAVWGRMLMTPMDSAGVGVNDGLHGDYLWIHTGFSDSPTVLASTADRISGNISGSNIYQGQYSYSAIDGYIIINNAGTVNKTYYYYVVDSYAIGAVPSGKYLRSFGGTLWSEDQLLAFPVQF